jgi:hypothetical protein
MMLSVLYRRLIQVNDLASGCNAGMIGVELAAL